ncbi:uncharacterized protein LOC128552897 [Mercenaria mercenaria]|uniref:uncharacterized protein LOC128552897 n=1 Tax=Mercenaria mercenaria TaxID=6596 RepID=UPI00234F3F89|nr:uncharacterized protein LOC128552897 [Mercenaria mercenaria]
MTRRQRLEKRAKELGQCTPAEKRPLVEDGSKIGRHYGTSNAGRNGRQDLHVMEKPVGSKYGDDSSGKSDVCHNTSTDQGPQRTLQKVEETLPPLNANLKHNRNYQKVNQLMMRSPEHRPRNKDKKQTIPYAGPENRISRFCVLMILLGLAVITLLAVFVYFLSGSSDTKTADGGGHSHVAANMFNKNGSVNYLVPNAASAEVPTRWDMNIILVLVTIAVLVTVVFVLCVILCYLKNRKLQFVKQTLPSSSRSTSRESLAENRIHYPADKLSYFEKKVDKIETESLLKNGTDLKLDHMSEISEESSNKTTAYGSNKMGKKKESPVFCPIEEIDSIDEDQKVKEAKCFKDSMSLEGKGITFTTENEFRAEIDVYQIEKCRPVTKGNLSTSGNLQGDECANARLNWDQIFSYLAFHMPQRNSTMFFQQLYGYGLNMLQEGTSALNIITQVEKNCKDDKSQSILLRQFHEWRQLLGNEARISHIKDALSNMGYIEILENFEKYVRCNASNKLSNLR